MAFVFKKKRFNEDKKDIDPPFYKGPELNKPKENLVPFNSTRPRLKIEKKKEPIKEENDFEKFYRILDQKKKLMYNKLKEDKNRKNNFSTETRFKKQEQNKLGPGVYNPYKYEEIEFKRKMDKPSIIRKERHKKNKQSVYSSIPYKERDFDDEVEMPERGMLNMTGTGTKVGPGKYNLTSEFDVNCKGIINWKNTKAKKLLTEELMKQGNPNLGPGVYNPIYEIKTQYKEKGLSSFLSAQPKSEFSKRNKKNNNKEWDKNAVPGPGHYRIAKTVEKPKKHKFQFFGVSVPRIAENYSNISAVGPGSYNFQSDLNKFNFINRKIGNMGFGNFQSRFSKTKNNANPGPGSYSNDISLVKPSFNKKGVFIDQKCRFKAGTKKKIIDHAYEFEIEANKENEPRTIQRQSAKKIEVPFMSTVKRETKITKKKDIPGIGRYNPVNYDLNYQVARNSHNRAKNVAFLSKSKRFSIKNKSHRKEETGTDFGLESTTNNLFKNIPTYHDYPKIKQTMSSSIFKSKSKRFQCEDKQNYRFYGQRPEWNTKSYNVNF